VHKGISAIVFVFVGLLAIAGCGGGDSSLSKAEYTQQSELVCNRGLKEREELLKDLTAEYEQRNKKQSSKEEAEEHARNVRKLMAVYQGTTEELADVGTPEEGEKMAEELIKAREDGTQKLESEPSAVAEFTTIFAKATKAAEQLGVASCGK
jgi:cytochrome P450